MARLEPARDSARLENSMPPQLASAASSWYGTFLSAVHRIRNEALARDAALRITDLVFEKCFAKCWWIFPCSPLDDRVCRNAAKLYVETSSIVAREVERSLGEGVLRASPRAAGDGR